jgi:hypothetical protein
MAAIARTTDPATSHEAAADVDLTRLQRMFVIALERIGRPATAIEVREHWRSQGATFDRADSIRKRASECVLKKLVRISGKARCKVTGRTSQIYEVTT